jgi:hypothetical protein
MRVSCLTLSPIFSLMGFSLLCSVVIAAQPASPMAQPATPMPAAAAAASSSDDEAVWGERIPLPADPAAWINSHPLTPGRLAGKTALVWFFDEECPLAAEQWPRLMQFSRKWADRPVAFIAVNSGNSRAALEEYVRTNRVDWPVIVDADRSLEKACKMDISLECVFQMTLISPDGKMWYGYHDKMESELEERMPNAKWELDLAEVPASMRQASRQVEFGDYASAAPVIKRNLTSTNDLARNCATKLRAMGEKQLAARLQSIRKSAALKSASAWDQYRVYQTVAAEFAGLELPTEINSAMAALEADPQVRGELAAERLWAPLEKSLAKGIGNVPQPAVAKLLKLYPKTTAARKARTAFAIPEPGPGVEKPD